MHTTDTIIVGAGQAGLAMSRCLTERAVDHVVLERGRLAERWRSESWDSLRLLSPNWMTRLPGWSYDGADPDGYMTAAELIAYFERYALASDAPVEERTTVESVRSDGSGYTVITGGGTWTARNVVIATGWCDRPLTPSFATRLPSAVHQLVPSRYRNPSDLPGGGVLVVGASATGVQLADELRRAGRDVTLAVGRHTRLPRRYRGMDVLWWLERMGSFDDTIDELRDPMRARLAPSMQLAGRSDGRSLDLPTLLAAGVRLTGRVTGADGARLQLSADLTATASTADARMRDLLADIDRHIDRHGLGAEVLDPDPPAALRADVAVDQLDLVRAGVGTVIWATGHRRTYPWLDVPVLDEHGEIRQRRGVTPAAGLYVLGQRFQHFRNSNFIDGVGRDAAFVADHLARRLATVSGR